MSEQAMAKRDNLGWIRCGRCGHKLLRITSPNGITPDIEIKCHSCKAMNYTEVTRIDFNKKEA